MRLRFVAMVFALVICAMVPAGFARQEQKNGIGDILGGFPNFHLLTLQERDADTRDYLRQHFLKTDTSVVKADFDGDGKLDYAILLKDNKVQAGKLVVLLCAGEGPCRSVYELDVSGYLEGTYLAAVKPGSNVGVTEAIDSKDETPRVKLANTGIAVNYFGKGQVVLYWDKRLKKIREIQTED